MSLEPLSASLVSPPPMTNSSLTGSAGGRAFDVESSCATPLADQPGLGRSAYAPTGSSESGGPGTLIGSFGKLIDTPDVRRAELSKHMEAAALKSERMPAMLERCGVDAETRSMLAEVCRGGHANFEFLRLQQSMHEATLTLELASKAIETGNAGVKQISQTQT